MTGTGAGRPVVWLLRAPRPDDPYERALREAGFTPHPVPVLDFVFEDPAGLARTLADPAHGALVLTSPRAAEAVARVWSAELRSRWQTRPVYVVGPRTGEAVGRLGLVPQGAEAGSAPMLADHILSRPPAGRLLFLTGDRRRDELPDRLRAAGRAFDERVVYRTHLRSRLDVSGAPSPVWVVWFSPSGVEAVEEEGGFDPRAVRRAAIGPTTAARLADAGWPAHAVADAPTPEGLVKALARGRRAG